MSLRGTRRIHHITLPSGIREAEVFETDSHPIAESDLHEWTREHFEELNVDAALVVDRADLGAGKEPDLLCVDRRGAIGIVEFKRDLAEREVLAQVLEYVYLLSEILRSDSRLKGMEWGGETLQTRYRTHFEQEIPIDSPKDPFIVIVAEEFPRDFQDMVDFFNSYHNLSISLVAYSRKCEHANEGFNFVPILSPDAECGRERCVPDRTFIFRFNEMPTQRWEQCIVSEQLTLNRLDALELQAASKSGPITLLIDIRRAGYVALAKLENDFPVYVTSDKEYLTIRVEWRHTVTRDKAVHRLGVFRSDRPLTVMTDLGSYQYITNRLRRLSRQKPSGLQK